jgi:phosphatidylinositol alpha-1,6-mannosyltransferase
VLTVGHAHVLAANRFVWRELARRHPIDVTIAAPRKFKGDFEWHVIEPEPTGSPVRLVGLGSRLSRFISVFHYSQAELRHLLTSAPFDVVHSWEEAYVASGYQTARSVPNASRFCFTTAQNLVNRYPWPFRTFERKGFARADAWVGCGVLVHETMARKGFPTERGHIISLGVDTDAFRPMSEVDRAAVRSQLGLTTPVVGLMGRLIPEKGIPLLLRALEALPASVPWSFVCLGSGPSEAAVAEWARRHGWESRVKVKWLKHAEVPRVLPALDVLVAPSQTMPNWREQFGRMLVEAMASGVAIIASDSGEIPHVVGQAGIIAGEKDVNAWTTALTRVLTDASHRAELASQGLARATLFSHRAVADQWAALFDRLVHGY